MNGSPRCEPEKVIKKEEEEDDKSLHRGIKREVPDSVIIKKEEQEEQEQQQSQPQPPKQKRKCTRRMKKKKEEDAGRAAEAGKCGGAFIMSSIPAPLSVIDHNLPPSDGEKTVVNTGSATLSVEKDDTVTALLSKIGELEGKIRQSADEYEKCRQLMAMGVASADAFDTVRKMEDLQTTLNGLYKEYRTAQDSRDKHIMAVIRGDEEALRLEAVRARRRKRYRIGGATAEKHDISEAEEVWKDKVAENMTKPPFKLVNAPNCPGQCKNLVEAAGSCVCADCGYVYADTQFEGIDTNSGVTWNEIPKRRSGGYKPIGHLSEILGHFQGRRTSRAPASIVETVTKFAHRYKYQDYQVTPDVVRMFLRRMQQDENVQFKYAKERQGTKLIRYTDYYKHAPEISERISHIPPPQMMEMQVERIMSIFPLVVAAYKTSPRFLKRLADRSNRKKEEPNMLNYSLSLYKICQLLGYEAFLPYIRLPKNTANIDDNDEMAWKHICSMYGWPYTPVR